MAIVLGFQSALAYWRDLTSRTGKPIIWPCLASLDDLAPTPGELERFLANPAVKRLGAPFHMLVSKQTAIRSLPNVIFHVRSGPLPEGSLCEVRPGLYVASPEMCLVEMATVFGEIELLQVGCELCGIYARKASDPNVLLRSDQITSATKIREYVSKAPQWAGKHRVSAIAKYIFDRSASPYEGKMGILFTLPNCKGGLGLPVPLFNYPHPIPASLRLFVAQTSYESDCFWPEFNVSVEYDSDLHHLTNKSHHHDAEKRTALKLLGIEVTTLTSGQLLDANLMEGASLKLHREMRLRYRIQTDKYLQKRSMLRSQLFG